MEWRISPGDTIRRSDVHDRYGGRRQGGIGPSRQSANVLVFSDPETGEYHGYYDHWDGGEFHYAGEGQIGDQQMVQGNAAILNHEEDGRSLRVFWGSAGIVQYAGEFRLSSTDPYYLVDRHESGGNGTRKVIMFRLVPVGRVLITDPEHPSRRLVVPDGTDASL